MLRTSVKKFLLDLNNEISDHNVYNGAAALAFYLILSIFPAAIVVLSTLPYLPIPNLSQAILGIYAIMQQLNMIYEVKESRPFWKVRGGSIILLAVFFVLIVGGFSLIIGGGAIQNLLADKIGPSGPLLIFFSVFRWAIVALFLLSAFAILYHFGPDVEQKFKFITPGSVLGVILLVLASLGFRIYVTNFSDYNATYGSLGAVIVLLMWFYIGGLVILVGSEVNVLFEQSHPNGKRKGEKKAPQSR
jgi:membrane protein